MQKPELLSPAGDLEKLKVAFAFGADAVYMGGRALGMRAKAKNFDSDEMEEGISYAHSLGKKVYITANIFAHNDDFTGMEEYFLNLEKMKADALIISDLGIFELAKKTVPNMPIHISTQANNTNWRAVNFWKNLGAKRVVLARELNLNEISEIRGKTEDIEIETFVHGAMCMAYSGRCIISNYFSHRDANRGECSHPCRWNYTLMEEQSGESLPVFEDDKGTYIFSSKDLCMIEHIPALVNAGISSFKIEGRMKTSHYVAAVTKTYREAIDDYFEDPLLYESKKVYFLDELYKTHHRDFTTGFYLGPVSDKDYFYQGDDTQLQTQDFLAIADSYDARSGICSVVQRNKFDAGDSIEILRANGKNHIQRIKVLYDKDGNKIDSAPHPKQIIRFKVEVPVEKFDIVRKVHVLAST
jgi:putative protease